METSVEELYEFLDELPDTSQEIVQVKIMLLQPMQEAPDLVRLAGSHTNQPLQRGQPEPPVQLER